MGRDKKDKKNKPTDIDIKKLNPKTGLIDAVSIKDYKSAYEQFKGKHGNQANPKLEEHIETRIHKTVDEQKKKRKRDITSVAASTAAGTVVPFSGIPIMVATTMVQCVGFSAFLGLIPIANVRSFQDVNTLATQLTSTLQKATSSGIKAAIEAFVLEILKQAGIGKWLWEEILKDTVSEITSGAVIDSAWVLMPLLAAPKYYLHRKLIKKMYVSLGEKAIVVHKAWVTDHLFLGKPETMPVSAIESASGYPSAYPTTGQPLYESNSDEAAVPYSVYYQPAFASSEHRAEPAHPRHDSLAHANSFPLQHHPNASQYAYYPPSYPMHPAHGQTISPAGSQHQQHSWQGSPQQYAPHQGPNYDPSSNYSQPPVATSQIPLVSHLHTSSVPHLQGPLGSSTSTSAPAGQHYSQAPPVGYPQQGQKSKSDHQYTQYSSQQGGYNYASPSSNNQQGQKSDSDHQYTQYSSQQGGYSYASPSSNNQQGEKSDSDHQYTKYSSQQGGYSYASPSSNNQQGQKSESDHQYTQYSSQQGGYSYASPSSSNPAANYSQAPPTGYPPPSYHGAYNPGSYSSSPPYQQAPSPGSSQHGHSQSAPPSGASGYSVQQSYFPSPYPVADQKPNTGKTSCGTPSVQHQQYPNAEPGSYPQRPPPQKQAEAC